MTKIYRLIESMIMLFLFTILLSTPALAYSDFLPEEGVYVYEVNSGTVLCAQNMDQPFYPASTTKLMTSIILLETVPDLNQIVECGDEVLDYGWDDSEAGLWEHQQVTYSQLLNCMLIPSGNDAAGVVAVNVGRILLNDPAADKETAMNAFIARMNERARELGTVCTNFVNPTGRSHPDHYSTPRDFAIIASEAFKHPEIIQSGSTLRYPITSIKGYTYDLVNTDKMIFPTIGDLGITPDPQLTPEQQAQQLVQPNPYYTSLITAGKTGTTDDDRKTFTFFSNMGGAQIVGVLFNHYNQEIFAQSKAILEEIQSNYVLSNLDESTLSGELELKNTSFKSDNSLVYQSPSPIYLFTAPGDVGNISTTITWDPTYIENTDKGERLIQDIPKDTRVGSYIVSLGDQELKVVPIYAQNELLVRSASDYLVFVLVGVVVLIVGFAGCVYLWMRRISRNARTNIKTS